MISPLKVLYIPYSPPLFDDTYLYYREDHSSPQRHEHNKVASPKLARRLIAEEVLDYDKLDIYDRVFVLEKLRKLDAGYKGVSIITIQNELKYFRKNKKVAMQKLGYDKLDPYEQDFLWKELKRLDFQFPDMLNVIAANVKGFSENKKVVMQGLGYDTLDSCDQAFVRKELKRLDFQSKGIDGTINSIKDYLERFRESKKVAMQRLGYDTLGPDEKAFVEQELLKNVDFEYYNFTIDFIRGNLERFRKKKKVSIFSTAEKMKAHEIRV
jgi:hypothetical protein